MLGVRRGEGGGGGTRIASHAEIQRPQAQPPAIVLSEKQPRALAHATHTRGDQDTGRTPFRMRRALRLFSARSPFAGGRITCDKTHLSEMFVHAVFRNILFTHRR